MKTIGFLLCLALTAGRAGAVEFRYRHAETTGLNSFLYDREGKETAVQFAGDSNAEAVALLNALLGKQIYGTKDVERRRGVRWEQAISLTGEFASGVKRAEAGTGKPESEKYRDFRVTGILLMFPVNRFELAAGGNPITGPIVIETHFGFDSLFPQGVLLNGKAIDLGKYGRLRSDANAK